MHELAVCTVRSTAGVEAVGFVREAGDGWLVVATEEDAILDPGWVPGVDVAVVVLDDVRGECSYRGETLEIRDDAIVVGLSALLGIEQKRSAARVRISIPCHGEVVVPWGAELDADGAPAAEAPAAEAPPAAAAPLAGEQKPAARELRFTVLDLSATGMRFMATWAVPTGAVVSFRLPVPGAAVRLHARVVRTTESRSGWHHGAAFEHLPASDAELLYRFVMREQGAQRRRQVLA